ncbi:MAG: hemerythrin domain-containing protein [Pseudomonadota bacterium]|nr:hemerythrin domain-containing protein [Pseudomonadota bacterium]
MTSLAEQNAAELGGLVSVLSRQKRDHVKLNQLLRRLDQAPPGEQDRVLLRIHRLVFPHAFAEEAVLWPVIRRVLPDGHELTLRVELEHQEINELVTQLEALEPGSIERQRVLDRVVELLRQDVRDEEDELLPRLQMKLTGAQLRRLGVAWEAVRLIAPTRAHPIVSRRPPGNVLAALPLSFLDRCRDRVDASLHRAGGAAVPRLRGLGSALARASHAVERLPGMQRGEDPATRRSRRSRVGWGAAAIITVAAAWVMMRSARRRR